MHKIPHDVRQEILNICNSPEYASSAPCEIVPDLADKGRYVASESTFYNDNPYAESLFKTLKYRPNYQPKGFATLEEARAWIAVFVNWYNYEHRHSGLKFLTPSQRRSGKGAEILEKWHEVYEKAKAEHPERWHGRKTRDWSLPEAVCLNPNRVVKDVDKCDNQEASAS